MSTAIVPAARVHLTPQAPAARTVHALLVQARADLAHLQQGAKRSALPLDGGNALPMDQALLRVRRLEHIQSQAIELACSIAYELDQTPLRTARALDASGIAHQLARLGPVGEPAVKPASEAACLAELGQDGRHALVQDRTVDAACAQVVSARAEALRLRRDVDAYVQPVFERFAFFDDAGDGGRLTKPTQLNRSHDELAIVCFSSAVHAAHQEHGHQVGWGECPALLAEQGARQAEQTLLGAVDRCVGTWFQRHVGPRATELVDEVLSLTLNHRTVTP